MNLVYCGLLVLTSLLGEAPPVGKSPKMDGTWKATSLTLSDGKKELSLGITGMQMVIKDGVGTWTDGINRGTLQVDLSKFSGTSPGFASAPVDFSYTEGEKKGLKWVGVCSRCGSAAIVRLSPTKRPEGFEGTEVEPVMLFNFKLTGK